LTSTRRGGDDNRSKNSDGPIAVHQIFHEQARNMTELIAPMLPLLAIMIAVLLFVTYVPGSFMWLPRAFGFAS
jgi:hypothetical protein